MEDAVVVGQGQAVGELRRVAHARVAQVHDGLLGARARALGAAVVDDVVDRALELSVEGVHLHLVRVHLVGEGDALLHAAPLVLHGPGQLDVLVVGFGGRRAGLHLE